MTADACLRHCVIQLYQLVMCHQTTAAGLFAGSPCLLMLRSSTTLHSWSQQCLELCNIAPALTRHVTLADTQCAPCGYVLHVGQCFHTQHPTVCRLSHCVGHWWLYSVYWNMILCSVVVVTSADLLDVAWHAMVPLT